MKTHLLLFFLLLIPFQFVVAQKKIDGFLGVDFGAPKKTIIETVMSKGGVLDESASTREYLTFANMVIGGHPSVYAKFYTSKNKFSHSTAVFKPASKDKALVLFHKMVEEISAVYGKGELHQVLPPKVRKGQELSAIESGNGAISYFWRSEADKEYENLIVLEITKDLLVKLDYQDGKLAEKAGANLHFTAGRD